MSSQHYVSSQAAYKFEDFLEQNSWGKEYCKSLALRWGWNDEDGEDIFALSTERIWKAYFSPNSTQRYQYKSSGQERKLLLDAFQSSASDVNRRRKRDAIYAQAVSFEELIDSSGGQDGDTFSDVMSSGVAEEEEICLRLLLEEIISEYCQKARTPARVLIIRYLLGEIDKDEVAKQGYTDNHIRVVKCDLKKVISHALFIDELDEEE